MGSIYKTQMDWILKKTGITTSWLSQQMNWGVGTADYAINERGLTLEETQKIQYIFNLTGQQLKNFKFSKNILKDIDSIRDNYGIKKIIWANALGVPISHLKKVFNRQSGLTNEELEVIELTKNSIANELMNFKFSKLKKAA